jgi:hypothetical protein
MDKGIWMFMSINILCLVVVGLNSRQIQTNPYLFIRIICTSLFLFTGLRYITLILYGIGVSKTVLERTAYFYFASSIGITIPSALTIWYMTPMYQEKIKGWMLFLILVPFTIFYITLILLQPTKIVLRSSFGYQLQLIPPWPMYLSIVQGIFTLLILSSCIYGICFYKNHRLTSQYLLFVLVYILTTIDGISMIFSSHRLIEPFTVSELFAFLAILYGFSKTKDLKRSLEQMGYDKESTRRTNEK